MTTPEIGIFNRSSLSDRDLAFQVAAVDVQLREHFIPAWSGMHWYALGMDYRLPEGDLPWPLQAFTDPSLLPSGRFWPLTVLDQVPQGEAGDHDDESGLISARCLANPKDPLDATVISHEALEMRGDPSCDLWMPTSPTVQVAVEAADAVEDDWYTIPIELGGELRQVKVSNFVLPAWWVAGAAPPYDYLGLCTKPQEIRPGGYVIQRQDGKLSNVFGDERGQAHFEAKRVRRDTRVALRIAKASR
jgi:hypothetical protein